MIHFQRLGLIITCAIIGTVVCSTPIYLSMVFIERSLLVSDVSLAMVNYIAGVGFGFGCLVGIVAAARLKKGDIKNAKNVR